MSCDFKLTLLCRIRFGELPEPLLYPAYPIEYCITQLLGRAANPQLDIVFQLQTWLVTMGLVVQQGYTYSLNVPTLQHGALRIILFPSPGQRAQSRTQSPQMSRCQCNRAVSATGLHETRQHSGPLPQVSPAVLAPGQRARPCPRGNRRAHVFQHDH